MSAVRTTPDPAAPAHRTPETVAPTSESPDAGVDAVSDPYRLVERELALLLRRAKSLAGTMSERGHPDLDPGAYPLLAYVARTPGVRSCDLAAQFGIGRATISRQVHHVEQLGLLTRRPDPQDARGQLLELTVEGSEFVTRSQDAGRRRLRAAFSSWSPDDVATLAHSLGRLNKTIDETARTS